MRSHKKFHHLCQFIFVYIGNEAQKLGKVQMDERAETVRLADFLPTIATNKVTG